MRQGSGVRALRVRLGSRSYSVIVGSSIMGGLALRLKGLNIGTDAFVITNALVKRKLGPALQKSLERAGFGVRFQIVADSEKSKSIESAARALKSLAAFDCKRKVFIIALGGGVVGDLSGFVASVYKRGIPYIQVPTTLLAQVDSAIGGKTAVDLTEGKNLVGAFYQPRLVYSDVATLSTLDRRQAVSGLAEVIKYGLIADKRLFEYIEKHYRQILGLRRAALMHIVLASSRIKSRFVWLDEREEKGRRTLLNFGHTMGHAIEAAGGYTAYSHGEAVGIGMLVATDISLRLGLISAKEALRIERLIRAVGLPADIGKLALNRVMAAHFRDKKFKGTRNRFVLLGGIGRAKVVEGVPLPVIRSALMLRQPH